MARFVEVFESRYGDKLLLNIENIVTIHEGSGTICTNAVHGNQDGLFVFNEENMKKIIDTVKELNEASK